MTNEQIVEVVIRHTLDAIGGAAFHGQIRDQVYNSSLKEIREILVKPKISPPPTNILIKESSGVVVKKPYRFDPEVEKPAIDEDRPY